MRVLDLLRKAMLRLEAGGIDDAAADAEIITFHAACMERLAAYTENPDVDSTVSARVSRLVRRRLAGEPVQYLTGEVTFMDLRIRVGKGVLIPRPETELLAQEAIAFLEKKRAAASQGDKVLDLCSGSGCISLAIASRLPKSKVLATEISPAAMRYARKNAKTNGIGNVRFLKGSLYDPLAEGTTYDVIVSNPPYIRSAEIATLQREVREWEPREALDGGEDGLFFYRAIVAQAPGRLAAGGALFLEIGYGQADAVEEIANLNGFGTVSFRKDYAGIRRICRIER